MWHTQYGDRILRGAEGALYREGLAALLFWLDPDEGDEVVTGVEVFDALTQPAKLAMLERVSRALLREKVRCPRLTAVAEGTVAAVYNCIDWELEAEIEDDEGCLWRRLIRSACVQRRLTDELPDVDSDNFELWRQSLDALTDQIFWDCDWENAGMFLDLHPAAARNVRSFAGILDDYYTAIAPEPSEAQLRRIRSSLPRLIIQPSRARRSRR